MPRPRDRGIAPGVLTPGPRNPLTDVPGVRVGHLTLDRDDAELPVRTGVTVVVPATGRPMASRWSPAPRSVTSRLPAWRSSTNSGRPRA
ncbi:P1 family peptidase [Streptomyces sp. NPDC056983]|uniref:P1 family peptidase n=1 Tax=Streptomyces sp. NPDC056983 TaxID=3345987 RepID=UPI0036394F41